MTRMHTLTLADQHKKLNAKEFSSVELTQHYLDRIKRFDSRINSFITVTEEQALADAKKR